MSRRGSLQPSVRFYCKYCEETLEPQQTVFQYEDELYCSDDCLGEAIAQDLQLIYNRGSAKLCDVCAENTIAHDDYYWRVDDVNICGSECLVTHFKDTDVVDHGTVDEFTTFSWEDYE